MNHPGGMSIMTSVIRCCDVKTRDAPNVILFNFAACIMYVKRETGHKCAWSAKSPSFFFFYPRVGTREKSHTFARWFALARRRKKGPLAFQRGSYFVSLTKCILIEEHSYNVFAFEEHQKGRGYGVTSKGREI